MKYSKLQKQQKQDVIAGILMTTLGIGLMMFAIFAMVYGAGDIRIIDFGSTRTKFVVVQSVLAEVMEFILGVVLIFKGSKKLE